jgi:hypothetical protein
MAFRVQVRRDTGQRWSLNNPILLNGEMGFNTDNNQFKIGNGTTTWNSLSYWTGGVGPTGPTGPIGLVGPTGPTGPGSSVSYKVYTALLTQTGEDAPVAIVLENTLGATLSYSRVGQGEYIITTSDTFPQDTTWAVINTPSYNGNGPFALQIGRISNTECIIYAYRLSDTLEDLETDGDRVSVEIRVYN